MKHQSGVQVKQLVRRTQRKGEKKSAAERRRCCD